uniref:MARVEL domain-containing protein n=1 Tax=Panagrellus redivivus TaxID=6233 RepID=A0A7E4VNE6_PANRE
MASQNSKRFFLFLIFVGFILTVIGFFSPGWRQYSNGGGEPQLGLASYYCGSGMNKVNAKDCYRWFIAREPWLKAVVAFMSIAFILEVVLLLITLVHVCRKRDDANSFAPAVFLCLLISICLLIAWVVFASKNQTDAKYMVSTQNQLNSKNYPGYSFYLTVISFVFFVFATLVGFYAIKEVNEEHGLGRA